MLGRKLARTAALSTVLVTVMAVAAALCLLTGTGAYASGGAEEPPVEDVQLTVLGESRVLLKWPVYPNSSYVYVVQVKVDEGNFVSVAEFSYTSTEYTYSGIQTSSVYAFRVMLRELRSGSRDSEYLNEVVYKPSGTQMLPTDAAATQVSPSEIEISWSYQTGAAFETVIERRPTGVTLFTPITTARAGVTRYIDASTEPNTLYTYRLRAKYGDYVYSAHVDLSVHSAIETPEIIGCYTVSPSSVFIEWTASSLASRYRIERKLKGTLEYTTVTTVQSDRVYFTDTGVLPGERYYYRVQAVSADASPSLYSEEVEVTVVYIEVSRLISAVATSDYSVLVTWSDLGDRESSYEVWRTDRQYNTWNLMASLPRNSVRYIDTEVGPNETYVYKVSARSAEFSGNSRFSGEALATTTFLEAPTNLTQSKYGAASVTLKWKDNSGDEGNFYIERRNGLTGAWSQLSTTAANVTERNGLSAPAGSAWYFRVGAYSSKYHSIAYSEPILGDNGYVISVAESPSYGKVAPGSGTAASGSTSSGSAASGSVSTGASSDGIAIDRRALDAIRKKKIAQVSNGGIVEGGELITRGEFVAMLVRALGRDGLDIGAFADVKRGHVYHGEIMRAAEMGFANAGFLDYFYPDRIITRGEIVEFVYDSMIANGTPLPAHDASAIRDFTDRNGVPAGLADKTNAVFGEKIMIGIGVDGGRRSIGLDETATRQQAALVVYRYMQWLGLSA